MTMSAEHRSKFAAFHRQKWRLQISGIFFELDEKLQTNKQTTNKSIFKDLFFIFVLMIQKFVTSAIGIKTNQTQLHVLFTFFFT